MTEQIRQISPRVVSNSEKTDTVPLSRYSRRCLPGGLDTLDWYRGGEYVITDQLGMPVHPEWYSDEFVRLLKRAGLPRITLHDSRHTTLTLMEHAGVPISTVSTWAARCDSAFTQKTSVHASHDDLRRGSAALARIPKIA